MMRLPICRRIPALVALALLGVLAPAATASPPDTTRASSKFRSAEDGWLDASGFLDEKYGFMPVVIPITEPAVGYGLGGALAFMSAPLGRTRAGFGRPNITVVGGMGTENGSWGTLVGDVRQWRQDRVQTLAGLVYASVNLDFHGRGASPSLSDTPLRYTLEPKGGALQGKFRLGDGCNWLGIAYAFAATRVVFEAPAGSPGLPDFERDSSVGGLLPSYTFDSRDNIFTPLGGTYVEATLGVFSSILGGDDEFQRLRLIAMQFVRAGSKWSLGMRGEAAATFGDVPFYLWPFINLRGVPVMRYQGEAMAQLETEVRWQFWRRFSLVGFIGAGQTWNEFEQFENAQSVVAGGGGFRYEIAREYGIHMGLDVAWDPENTALYIQMGSAWARP